MLQRLDTYARISKKEVEYRKDSQELDSEGE
jgi:hypothetical protein